MILDQDSSPDSLEYRRRMSLGKELTLWLIEDSDRGYTDQYGIPHPATVVQEAVNVRIIAVTEEFRPAEEAMPDLPFTVYIAEEVPGGRRFEKTASYIGSAAGNYDQGWQSLEARALINAARIVKDLGEGATSTTFDTSNLPRSVFWRVVDASQVNTSSGIYVNPDGQPAVFRQK